MTRVDPMQFLQMIKNGGNPQQIMLNFLEQQSAGNPMMQNLLSLAKQGKEKEIEGVVRNIFKERGLDYDKEFSKFKNQMRIK